MNTAAREYVFPEGAEVLVKQILALDKEIKTALERPDNVSMATITALQTQEEALTQQLTVLCRGDTTGMWIAQCKQDGVPENGRLWLTPTGKATKLSPLVALDQAAREIHGHVAYQVQTGRAVALEIKLSDTVVQVTRKIESVLPAAWSGSAYIRWLVQLGSNGLVQRTGDNSWSVFTNPPRDGCSTRLPVPSDSATDVKANSMTVEQAAKFTVSDVFGADLCKQAESNPVLVQVVYGAGPKKRKSPPSQPSSRNSPKRKRHSNETKRD
jgi:hypothetical protein